MAQELRTSFCASCAFSWLHVLLISCRSRLPAGSHIAVVFTRNTGNKAAGMPPTTAAGTDGRYGRNQFPAACPGPLSA
jgi:hypothetical protein